MTKDKVMTAQEVADFLGVTRPQIYRWRAEGKLIGCRLGNGTGKRGSRREWRFLYKDVMAFVKQGRMK